MQIHPREAAVKAAQSKIAKAIVEAVAIFGLTRGEELRVVNGACSEHLGIIAKHWIREDRGDPDRPGGRSIP